LREIAILLDVDVVKALAVVNAALEYGVAKSRVTAGIGIIRVRARCGQFTRRGEGHILGQQFIDYLISPSGQADIAHYKIGGQQLFYPDANDPTA
jgi:hypothetical protein